MRLLLFVVLWTFGASTSSYAAPSTLDERSTAKLDSWFRYTAKLAPADHFGALVADVAKFHVGSPYYHEPQPSEEPRTIDITLTSHQCVSLIEQSIAVASCHLLGTRTTSCFVRMIEKLRYRHGRFQGYTSRLHYFVDWYNDNIKRGTLGHLGESHTFRLWKRKFQVMSKRPDRYPILKSASKRREIESIEESLSNNPFPVIPKHEVARASDQFEHGDIIGIVTHHGGLAVTHVGLAFQAHDGTVRLLHASSYHERVVITVEDITNYIERTPKRQGIMTARPLPLTLE